MHKILKPFLLSILFILIVGCSSNETKETSNESKEADVKEITEVEAGGEIKVAYSAQPQILDPQMSGSIATTDIMWHVYETLLGVNENYEIEPMLADSYEQNEDGTEVTFHLREGVLFHNGEEMTADDVVASMERWASVSTFGQMQFHDAEFIAEDDYTVVLKLSEPRSTALNSMAYPLAGFAAIMPKDVIDAAEGQDVQDFIGTGPFKFVEWKQNQHVHLEKFEDYQAVDEPASLTVGKKQALVDDLYFIFSADSSTRVAGLESGEYDVAHGVQMDHAERLDANPEITNHVFPAAYLVANFNKKKGLFTDENARLAVSAALDMEAILQAAFTNDEYYTLNHSGMMYHQLEVWNSEVGKDLYNIADVDLAKELLEQANYDGETITIITDREYEEHYNASVVIQEQLEQIGMNAELEVFDWATVLEKIDDEDAYDLYVMGLTPNADPSGARYLSPDYAGWTNSDELDDLLEEFRSQPDIEGAKALYDDLQQWYWNYMPTIRIGDYNAIVSTREHIQGFEEQNKQHRPIYWNVSVDR